MVKTQDRTHTVRRLAEQLRRLEEKPASQAAVVSSGVHALDGLLPDGGYRRGTLIEWIGSGEGSGATTLALQTARQACTEGGVLIVVDRDRLFYPPAARALGIDLQRLVVVRPSSVQEEVWALDQSLRCQGVAAVLGAIGHLDDRCFRRLQLSAESGQGLGIFLRPPVARQQPTWAETRWLAEPLPLTPIQAMPRPWTQPPSASHTNFRRVRATLLRSRNSLTGQQVELEIEGSVIRPARPIAQPGPAALPVQAM